MKICLHDDGHMTKITAMPIDDKNHSKIFLSDNVGPISMKLGMKQRRLLPIIFYINDDHGLTMTYFTSRSNFVTKAFLQEKVKKWIFQKLMQPVT